MVILWLLSKYYLSLLIAIMITKKEQTFIVAADLDANEDGIKEVNSLIIIKKFISNCG